MFFNFNQRSYMTSSRRKETKACSICGELFPNTIEYFTYKSKTKLRSYCKACHNKKQRDKTSQKQQTDSYRLKDRLIAAPCKDCGRVFPVTDKYFTRNSRSQIGFRLKCKQCLNGKHYDFNYHEKIEYLKNNKLKKCTMCKEVLELDKFAFIKSSGIYNGKCKICSSIHRTLPLFYDSILYKKISKHEECRRHPYSKTLVQVKCAYCNKWIDAKRNVIVARLNSINGISPNSDSKIYCSDNCKNLCPVFRMQINERNQANNTSREVDPELRKMCFERDNWLCVKCGNNDNLHCHHILSYAHNKILSNDLDNVITVCKECHNKIHKTEGCKYHQLRCDN